LILAGNNPVLIPETKDCFIKKWKIFFDIFLICRDARYNNLIHLPFDGSVIEQPCKTMEVIQYIQNLYRKDDMEKQKREQSKIRKPARR
jgi:hypothetical protein